MCLGWFLWVLKRSNSISTACSPIRCLGCATVVSGGLMAKSIISDMDGVIYRGKQLIPGAKECVARLIESQTPFLFLTNNAEQTPLDLKLKLEGMGIAGVREDNFITSAMATAMFLKSQTRDAHPTAYVVGGGGLINELYNVGFSISESQPNYVVVAKTLNFGYEQLKKAVQLIDHGAKFIGTNPDMKSTDIEILNIMIGR